MNINDIIDKLFDFYKVTSLVELSAKLNISQPALSQWKSRNAINAVKKKCRELNIYNEIFKEYDLDEVSSSYINNSMEWEDTENENLIKDMAPYLEMEKLLYNKRNALKNLKIDNDIIDSATFFLFSEAYFGALSILHLKDFRIHLINFSHKNELNFIELEIENFNLDEKNSNLISLLNSDKIIDSPTFYLFLETYKIAKRNNALKEFRTHLMEYNFNDLGDN